MNVIDTLLQGTIDIHVHHSPDPKVERKVDALQAALQAQKIGMRAIVLKSHEYSTAPLAHMVSQVERNIVVLGSICLNFEVGGLNAHAVEASAKMGAKIVWMPTLSSANDMRKRNLDAEGITIFDDEGKLLPVVKEILDIIKSYQLVLATGHLSVAEAFALVDEAKRRGIPKIVICHPLLEMLGAHLTLEEQQQMVEKGAFVEHCFSHTFPSIAGLDPMIIVEAVRAVGAEHCIMSTDLGQYYNPPPAEGMRMMIATMLRYGLAEKELELMTKINPARLLDLD